METEACTCYFFYSHLFYKYIMVSLCVKVSYFCVAGPSVSASRLASSLTEVHVQLEMFRLLFSTQTTGN